MLVTRARNQPVKHRLLLSLVLVLLLLLLLPLPSHLLPSHEYKTKQTGSCRGNLQHLLHSLCALCCCIQSLLTRVNIPFTCQITCLNQQLECWLSKVCPLVMNSHSVTLRVYYHIFMLVRLDILQVRFVFISVLCNKILYCRGCVVLLAVKNTRDKNQLQKSM